MDTCWMIGYVGHIACRRCKAFNPGCTLAALSRYYTIGSYGTMFYKIKELYQKYDEAWERYESKISMDSKREFGVSIAYGMKLRKILKEKN